MSIGVHDLKEHFVLFQTDIATLISLFVITDF